MPFSSIFFLLPLLGLKPPAIMNNESIVDNNAVESNRYFFLYSGHRRCGRVIFSLLTNMRLEWSKISSKK